MNYQELKNKINKEIQKEIFKVFESENFRPSEHRTVNDKKTDKIISTVFESLQRKIIETLQKNDKVTIPGIGVFFSKEVKERKNAYNISSKKHFTIPRYNKACFTASKKIKDNI